eukprot:1159207-Pelagomonas_calceolata.AAC.15
MLKTHAKQEATGLLSLLQAYCHCNNGRQLTVAEFVLTHRLKVTTARPLTSIAPQAQLAFVKSHA